MSKLTIITMLFVVGVQAQSLFTKDTSIAIGGFAPLHKLFITSPSHKTLYLDFAGDSLVTGGTLEPDSAAQIFLVHVVEMYSHRIKSLKDEISTLRQQLKHRNTKDKPEKE